MNRKVWNLILEGSDDSLLLSPTFEDIALQERPAYVYTYPPKGAYRPAISEIDVLSSWRSSSGRLNIYVHFPYCELKCSFCNLFTTQQSSVDSYSAYWDAVLLELDLYLSRVDFSSYSIASVYFGGGTPSLLQTSHLVALKERILRSFRSEPDIKFSIEATPHSVDAIRLRDFDAIGLDRLSIGVQSFNSDDLISMGRDYDAGLNVSTIKMALEAGIKNVNIDLIFGLPSQDFEVWKENLALAVSNGVPTVSIYPLTLRDKTRFGRSYLRGNVQFPEAKEMMRCYEYAADFLNSHGYVQYSPVGFSLLGDGNPHEINEFEGVPTLGLGAGALSYSPQVHYSSCNYLDSSPARDIDKYVKSVHAGDFPIFSGIVLDESERKRRFVVLSLLHLGFSPLSYLAKFRSSFFDDFAFDVSALSEARLLKVDTDRVELSYTGRKHSAEILRRFYSSSILKLSAPYS